MYFLASEAVLYAASADELNLSVDVLEEHGGRLIGGEVGVVEIDLVEGVDDL